MTRTPWIRWIAAALLAGMAALAAACDSDDGGGGGGAGGTAGAGGTGGGPPEPVVCDELLDQYPEDGDGCTMPGDICDIPGGTCLFQCGDDLIWHESCWTCPSGRPTQGGPCDPAANSGDCSYPPDTTCGPGSGTTFTCEPMTSTWQEVDVQPCP